MHISSFHPSPLRTSYHYPPVGSQSVNMQVTDTGTSRSIVEQDIPGESTALDEVAAVLQYAVLAPVLQGTLVPHRAGTIPERNTYGHDNGNQTL